MQTILKKVVWACLLVIPFIALYVASGYTSGVGGNFLDVINWGTAGLYFPFISGKNLLFRILVEIAFFSWILLALGDVRYRISVKKSPLLIAYGIFMGVLLLADIFGVNPHRSFWSNFERMEGFLGHLHFFAYFVVLSGMLATVQEYKKMFTALIASNIAVLAFGYAQLFGWYAIHMSENRLDSTIGNSAYFAMYCLFFIFFLALRWSEENFSWTKWLYPLLIVLNLVALFYTGTRGTQIGLLVGGFTTLALLGWHEKGKVRRFAGLSIAVAAILVASVFMFKNTSFVQSSPTLARFASISPSDLTGMSRLSIWKISFEAWKERPVLGYGQENFMDVFAAKFIPEKMWRIEPWYDRSHDVFFDWLMAAGTLGLLSYLSLYAVSLWLMWARKNEMPFRERAIITGALAGYFVHNIFVFDNLTSYILFFFLLAYIAWRTGTRGDVHEGKTVSKDTVQAVWLPLLIVLLLASLYVVVYRPFLTNKLMVRGLDINRLVQNMSVADAVKVQREAFEKAVALNTTGSTEAREQFMITASRMAQVTIPADVPAESRQKTVQAINELVQAARKDVETSYPRYEDDARMLSIFGLFFINIGDGATAERILTRAHELAPKKQLISIDLIKAYLIQNKNSEAHALARETFDLAPEYQEASKIYLVTAAYAGKWAEAKAYVLSKGLAIPISSEIISALVNTNQTREAVNLLNEMKAANPEYASQIDAYIQEILAQPKR